MDLDIRELNKEDLPFLREMLYAALFWSPGRLWPPAFLILRLPQVSMFYRGWGRPGDIGFVAEAGGGDWVLSGIDSSRRPNTVRDVWTTRPRSW